MNTAGLPHDPGGVAFVTPAGWQTIKVPRTSADIERLTSGVTAIRPGLALRRAAIERMLNGLVQACAALDVLSSLITFLDVPGGPLPATLIASAQPTGSQTVAEIAQGLAGPAGTARAPTVRMFDLPAGPTARVERWQEWPDDTVQPLVFLVIHYVAELPGADGALLLTFSTPALAQVGQLRPLFHQIACTLHFGGTDIGQ
jgi:hypothetical protein